MQFSFSLIVGNFPTHPFKYVRCSYAVWWFLFIYFPFHFSLLFLVFLVFGKMHNNFHLLFHSLQFSNEMKHNFLSLRRLQCIFIGNIVVLGSFLCSRASLSDGILFQGYKWLLERPKFFFQATTTNAPNACTLRPMYLEIMFDECSGEWTNDRTLDCVTKL